VSAVKTVAIIQSNYIPWKGYFDIIDRVDEFILMDDVQFTRRDWRNRNKIKTSSGAKWVTIPVNVKGKYFQKINATKVVDDSWARSHWSAISQSYRDAEYFGEYAPIVESVYEQARELEFISDINELFIMSLCRVFGIDTPIRRSSEFSMDADKNLRLINLCKDVGANKYLSGPAASSYMDVDLFRSYGIDVEWMNYDSYPTYSQLHGDFLHGVSMLDVLFCCGSSSKDMIFNRGC